MKTLIIIAILLSAIIPIITGFLTSLFLGFVVGLVCIIISSMTIAYNINGAKNG